MEMIIDLQVDEEFMPLVNVEDLQQAVAATLQRHADELGETVEVALLITGNDVVQELNRTYRGLDAPTDVLSFSAQETVEVEPDLALPPELAAELDRRLGDIVIAYPYAERQAQHFGNSVASELRLLAIHGTLHLLGYDHAEPDEEQAMWAVQEAILTPLGDARVARRVYSE
jgi:probable rRNA maturation factor